MRPTHGGDFADGDPADWELMWRIKLRAPMLLPIGTGGLQHRPDPVRQC